MTFSASHIQKEYGGRQILNGVALSLEEGEKAALVGINGTGKSTLLKILAGQEDGEAEIHKPRTSRIHYLPQSPLFTHDTVQEEIDAWNRQQTFPKEQYELQSILTRLGLKNAPIRTLSGGQKKRLALAQALITDADILLLDEPTNHLDTDMIEWLESQLNKSGKTILTVSHDRTFLEHVCSRIFELEGGNLYSHEGGYDKYLEQVAERKAADQKRQKSLENQYRRELAWVRAGVQARSTKSRSRLDHFQKLRQQRQTAKEQELQLTAPSRRLGKKIGEWHDLAFGYGQVPLFSGFFYTLKKGDRIGITGPNGCGKTTLLHVLAQRLIPTAGNVEWGSTVRFGWCGQGEQAANLQMTVLDFVEESACAIQIGGSLVTSAQMLERFRIPRAMHRLPLEKLSGGERKRVYLLKVLMQGPNVLFLDEPTNDLDLVTLQILEDYLDTFPGVVITVCHDRYFLDRVCETLFVFENGTIRESIGGYTEYLLARTKPGRPKKEPVPRKQRTYALTWAEKQELESLPAQLEELENAVADLNRQMEADLPYERLAALCARRDGLEQELEERTERWMELEEKREG